MPTPSAPIVLDTCVVVAFALQPPAVTRRGVAVREAVERALTCFRLLASDATLAELEAVLLRPCFERHSPRAGRAAFVAGWAGACRRIADPPPVRLCRDPEDDPFLALALAGHAPWLVTLDRQLLSVRAIGSLRVVRPERFLALTAG